MSESTKLRIAFFGLGIMGSGMVNRLLGAGFPVTVYNRNADKAKPFVEAGAKLAKSTREAAADADVIFSMVADDAASQAMWLGEQGALAGTTKGAVLIECSTLTVKWVGELSQAAKRAGCELLDAPVTGSKPQAAAGELNFLVGGPAEAIEKARPALAAMSKAIIHLGPTGSGALMKLINNFVCGAQLVALAEAVTLIERSGLDRTKALEILQNGAPGSPLVKTMSNRMTAKDYTPNFPMKLMAKDLNYAIEEAGKFGLKLGTVTAALQAFNAAMKSGHAEQDFSSVVEQYRAS
jgi:3-hydroxyisobutyrate dehydrogenase